MSRRTRKLPGARMAILIWLALIFYGLIGGVASVQTGTGKSFDEVAKLAAKGGKVRVGSGLTAEETPFVLKGSIRNIP